MENTFSFLSQFAQSWALAGMTLFFVAAVLWVFRPGSRKVYDDAARSILGDDTKPMGQGPAETPDRRAAVKGA